MENVAAILLTNSEIKNATVDTLIDSQQVLNNPMVIIFNKETKEMIKFFRIAADTMEQLTEMYKYKYFETPDLPEERFEKILGAYFVGCGPCQELSEEVAAV